MANPGALEGGRMGIPSEQAHEKDAARGKRRWWIWVLVFVLLAYGGWRIRGAMASKQGQGSAAMQNQNRPVPVVVATASKGDIPVILRGLGNVTAFNTVTVRSRVDGQLVKVAFQEGQFVKEGDLLAEIDPRPFQVQLDQAQGQLARDTAQLNDAKINYDRYQGLYSETIIPKQQLDTQRALVAQYEGAIQADEATINNAKLNLTYCHIVAPISGRVGLRLVDIGNIVHASDQNGLLVITQLQPIAVLFSLPQDSLPDVFGKLRAGAHLTVEAYDQNDLTRIAAGTLLTIDNQIDPTTGTYKLKAVFDNRDDALFPNQFVNVHMLVGRKEGQTIVPAAAVQHGPQQTYVYVVGAENIVKVRPVKVDVTEGGEVGISNGLQPGEVVVTDGQDKLQDGSKIDAQSSTGGPAEGSGSVPNPQDTSRGHQSNEAGQGKTQ